MIKKLVLVDDDRDMRFLHTRLIRKSGLVETIIEFKNGKDALNYIKEERENPPQIIILDINMPGISGWDVADALRDDCKELKGLVHLFILTSSVNPNDFSYAEEHPCIQEILEKPLNQEKLQMIIDSASAQ
ncbi:MAG: response regulator transcription factor [Fluviicola sp.]